MDGLPSARYTHILEGRGGDAGKANCRQLAAALQAQVRNERADAQLGNCTRRPIKRSVMAWAADWACYPSAFMLINALIRRTENKTGVPILVA